MDISTDSPRNGLDSGFFYVAGKPGAYADFLGIAISRTAKQKKYSNAETARLLQTYPPRDTVDGQKAVLAQLDQSRIMLEDGLKKAKSRKTKNSITGQLAAHAEYIADMQGVLQQLVAAEAAEAEAQAAAAAAGAAAVATGQVSPPVGSQIAQVLSGQLSAPSVSPDPLLNQGANSQPILQGAVLSGTATVQTPGGAAVLPTVTTPGAEGGQTTVDGTPISGKSKTMTYVIFGVIGIALLAFITRKKV